MMYDSKVFRSVSNSGTGEVSGETVFQYHQTGALVWAEYAGGAIVKGFLIATIQPDNSLDMRYQHVNQAGDLMTGICQSTPERLTDGRLRLHEPWQWTSGDGSSGEWLWRNQLCKGHHAATGTNPSQDNTQLSCMVKIRLYACMVMVQLLSLMGCARQQSLMAELQPRTLTALNLEETLSRRDEVMLAYSLTAYDAQNKAIAVVNGAWGVETVKKGQVSTLSSNAKPIHLVLPRRGRIVASVVLIEVDDYARAGELLGRIQKIQNVVSVPVGLILSATEVLTPLKYVTAGLLAAGLGLRLTDHFDTDDVLGQSSTELRDTDGLRLGQRLMHVPAEFSGQHLRDRYQYKLTYDVALKTVKLAPANQ